MPATQIQHSLLADFINHGTLPFVGRHEEIDAIVRFWHLTEEAHELRSMLLIGEAGVGKSRLIQEVINRIELQGGVVVHARLYPESANAIAPILAGSLWQSSGARQLLKSEPDGTLSGVISSLRRFARLRPTIVILEDIHLFVPEAMRDFAAMLEAITDEPLALICASRPVELLARGVLERSLAEEIRIEGLTELDMTDLWRSLFRGEVPLEAVRTLSQSTLGNALALRSALRNAINQQMITQQPSGYWEPDAGFQRVVVRSVRSLSEGMTIQFTGEERNAAERLATLGEIFSREAAGLMGMGISIDDLIFKGLLVELSLPRLPLPALPKSEFPVIAFTHSLIHRQLLESASSVPYDSLLRILAARLPLYTLLPFELLAADNVPVSLSPLELCELLKLCMDVAYGLNMTSDWKLATMTWAVGDAILKNNADQLDELQRRELGAELLNLWLGMRRRYVVKPPEYGSVVAELMDITEPPLSLSLVESRLSGYIAEIWSHIELHQEDVLPQRDNIVQLVEQFPELRFTATYVAVLRDLYHFIRSLGDVDEQRRIEGEYQAIIGSEQCTEEIRSSLQRRLAPHLLLLFDTPAELENRNALYSELEATADESNTTFGECQVEFLQDTGRVDELLAALERTIPLLKTRGFLLSHYNHRVIKLCAEGLLGADLSSSVGEVEAIVDTIIEVLDVPVESRHHIEELGYVPLLLVGLLVDDREWTEKFVENYIDAIYDLLPVWGLVSALRKGGSMEKLASLVAHPELDENLRRLVRSLVGSEDADDEGARYGAITILQQPVLRTRQIWDVRLAVELCEEIEKKQPGFLDPIHPYIHQALTCSFEWLAERRLPLVMEPIVRNHARYFTDKQLGSWRKKVEGLHRERKAERKSDAEDRRVRVSLIGKIEVKSPDQLEPAQPRGSRMRAFLGAMAAAAMMPAPIPREDFFRILSIELDDSKQTRDLINSAIYRLRELLGHEGILTDGDVPRLNQEHINVDAIEAHALLNEAGAATRRRELMRAQRAVVRVLEMVGGSGAVLFPTLYDSFFEAMREDFESRLRSAVIDVSSMLLREGDAPGAEEILRRAYELMPDDEEMGEIYREALKGSGRIAEAELVRNRVEAAL